MSSQPPGDDFLRAFAGRAGRAAAVDASTADDLSSLARVLEGVARELDKHVRRLEGEAGQHAADEELLGGADSSSTERRQGEAPKGPGRPPEPLPLDNVLRAEEELRKRAALPEKPRTGHLTISGIAVRTGLNRDRVCQIEDLIELGWPLRENHPGFSAAPGEVRLPTAETARLLGLRRVSSESRGEGFTRSPRGATL